MVKRADFSAVIFDMDGLVLDTERTFKVAWKKASRKMGHELSESFFSELSGLPLEGVLRAFRCHFGGQFDFSEFNRLSAQYWRDYVSEYGIDTKQGFESLLDFLAHENIPYCLATNSAADIACECLERAGIKNVFSIMITRDQVPLGKPAPDLFLAATERLQVPIAQCLVLEDSHVGIEAASRAGAIPVLINSERPVGAMEAGFCDIQLNDLGQLLGLIRDSRSLL